MASIVGVLATSHAFASLDPDQWDARRDQMRASHERRYGVRPDERPGLKAEDLDANAARFPRWRTSPDAAHDCFGAMGMLAASWQL